MGVVISRMSPGATDEIIHEISLFLEYRGNLNLKGVKRGLKNGIAG